MGTRAATWMLCLAVPAGALAAGSDHVEATLLSEVRWIQPGKPFRLGLRLRMAEHWHTYWKNPGDSGLPTRIVWTLPEGFAAGPIEWPRPRRIDVGSLVNYGYEGEVLLTTEIEPPARLETERNVVLAARASWLECRETCLPGKADVRVMLPVRNSSPEPAPESAPLFAATRGRLPVEPAGWRIDALPREGAIVLRLRPPAGAPPLEKAYFFPEEPEVIEHAAPQRLAAAEGGYHLVMARAANAKPVETLKGVLVVGQRALRIDLPATRASDPEIRGPRPRNKE